jgi:DNA polymerase-3 subunit alpha
MAQDIELRYDPHLRPTPKVPEGHDVISYYRQRINEGFQERYGDASEEVRQEAIRRKLAEKDIIEASGFAGYMLVVEDYLNWTKKNFSTRDEAGDILAYPIGGGRGSVGGSIHAYELGISELCPIRWDLITERFLSAGRGATYEVVYDDGSVDTVLASEIRGVLNAETEKVEKKYIHQLEIGDTVAVRPEAD